MRSRLSAQLKRRHWEKWAHGVGETLGGSWRERISDPTREQNVSPPTVRMYIYDFYSTHSVYEFHCGHDGHIAKAERPSAVMSEETLILSAVFRGF